MDIKLLVAQLINFSILFFVLSKILYKPIIKVLDDRKKKVDEMLKNSQEIEEKLVKLEERQKEILKEARSKANEETQVVMKVAQEEREKIIEDAKAMAAREAEKAVGKIQTMENEAVERLEGKISDQLVQKVIDKIYPKKSSKKPLLNDLLGR